MARYFKVISLVSSHMRKSSIYSSFPVFTASSCSKFVPTVSHFLCADEKLVHTAARLRSSEVELKKEAGNVQENVDQYDELNSKVGIYSELASDVDSKKKILMILMEHEVAKLEGKKVPSKISIQDMSELLGMYSFSSRVKYLGFLFEKELRRAAERRKREIKKKEHQVWLVEKETIKPPEHIQYGIGHNTMVLRVRRSSMVRVSNQRLANAVMYSQKFIIDMDYDCFMRKQDCTNCGEQLLELYGANRKNRYPYDLFFCNVDLKSSTMAAFKKYMPNLYAPDNFITLSELSYTDMFPKEKLVYITPFAKEPMRTYDPNAIYIIGGLVDKCIKEPVVLAKAKREGIRVVHLPYDEYLMWGRGNKSLPLNQVMDILLEMKNTNDWNKAFRYVPQRKLVRSLDLFSEF